jgi:hypothetical protein
LGDYEEYADVKHEELGHWKGLGTDHNGVEQVNHHHDHFYGNSGNQMNNNTVNNVLISFSGMIVYGESIVLCKFPNSSFFADISVLVLPG